MWESLTADKQGAAKLTFADEAVFEICPGVESARHVDGMTLRHPKTGAYFSLSGSAAFIWGQLELLRSLSAIKLAAAQHYEVPQETVEPSIDAFVADLVDEGLLLQ